MVAVLVCLSLVPVQGTSLVQSFVSWTGDQFSFTAENTSSGNQDIFSDLVYQQVEEKISSFTDQPVLPTWYPEGSSVIRVEENEMDDGYNTMIVFSLDSDEFLVTVGIYETSSELPFYEYEKNPDSVEEYYVNNIPHYIMGNVERNTATWRNENIECSIQGSLPADTLKQMIDSIYS